MDRRKFMVAILSLFGLPVLAKIKIPEVDLVDSVKATKGPSDEDWTLEMWSKPVLGEWQHIARVYEGNKVHIYADGFYVKTIDSYINAHGTIEKVIYNG